MHSTDPSVPPDSATTVSDRVVDEVANVLNADPLDLDPLYETIDPEALDSLFQSSSETGAVGRVEFEYEDCLVTVFDTGDVTVIPQGSIRDSPVADERESVTGRRREGDDQQPADE